MKTILTPRGSWKTIRLIRMIKDHLDKNPNAGKIAYITPRPRSNNKILRETLKVFWIEDRVEIMNLDPNTNSWITECAIDDVDIMIKKIVQGINILWVTLTDDEKNN